MWLSWLHVTVGVVWSDVNDIRHGAITIKNVFSTFCSSPLAIKVTCLLLSEVRSAAFLLIVRDLETF